MSKKYRVGVVGATGIVGQEITRVLIERQFPFTDLKLLASSRSAGTRQACGRDFVAEATPDSFAGLDFVFLAPVPTFEDPAPERKRGPWY